MDLGMFDMSARGYLRQCIKEHAAKPAPLGATISPSGSSPVSTSTNLHGVGSDALAAKATQGQVTPVSSGSHGHALADDSGSVYALMDLFPDIDRGTIERVLAASGSTIDATTTLCAYVMQHTLSICQQ